MVRPRLESWVAEVWTLFFNFENNGIGRDWEKCWSNLSHHYRKSWKVSSFGYWAFLHNHTSKGLKEWSNLIDFSVTSLLSQKSSETEKQGFSRNQFRICYGLDESLCIFPIVSQSWEGGDDDKGRRFECRNLINFNVSNWTRFSVLSSSGLYLACWNLITQSRTWDLTFSETFVTECPYTVLLSSDRKLRPKIISCNRDKINNFNSNNANNFLQLRRFQKMNE